MINIKNDELETLLIYAQRYAIGRMTYAPAEVSELVRKYMPYATTDTLGVLIQDIERQGNTDAIWLDLLDELKDHRQRRV